MPQLADHYVAFGNKIGHQPRGICIRSYLLNSVLHVD